MREQEQIGYIHANWATWICARPGCYWTVPPSYRTEHGCISMIRLHIALHDAEDKFATHGPLSPDAKPQDRSSGEDEQGPHGDASR